jgi:hypothetical protein
MGRVLIGREVSADNSTLRLAGNYPSPRTRIDGMTADQYAEMSKDANFSTCLIACAALGNLNEEGLPFLLLALEAQKDRKLNLCNVMEAISYHQLGSAIAPDDLYLIAAFLDDKYGNYILVDRHSVEIRVVAAEILSQAGPAAKEYLHDLERLARAFQATGSDGSVLKSKECLQIENGIKRIKESK